jgi:hypothetical protein
MEWRQCGRSYRVLERTSESVRAYPKALGWFVGQENCKERIEERRHKK